MGQEAGLNLCLIGLNQKPSWSDEPLIGSDPHSIDQVMKVFMGNERRTAVPFWLSTHYHRHD